MKEFVKKYKISIIFVYLSLITINGSYYFGRKSTNELRKTLPYAKQIQQEIKDLKDKVENYDISKSELIFYIEKYNEYNEIRNKLEESVKRITLYRNLYNLLKNMFYVFLVGSFIVIYYEKYEKTK